MFVCEGVIVPTGPTRQYVSEPVPERLNVDVYPGPDGSFVLYEDDGASLGHTRGVFVRTELKKVAVGGGAVFSVRRIEGSFGPAARSLWLHFQAETAAPASVDVHGAPLVRASSEPELETSIGPRSSCARAFAVSARRPSWP